MKTKLARFFTENYLAIIAVLIALLVLAFAWQNAAQQNQALIDATSLIIVAALAAAIFLANRFPIHIRLSTKVSMSSVPLYLAAVLLPPHLAAMTAGFGILLAEWTSRRERGLLGGDIAFSFSRLTVVVFAGSALAHLPSQDPIVQSMLLFGVAAVMFVGDAVTFALQASAVTGENLFRVLFAMWKEGALVEAVQYLIGILGALAAFQKIWALALLALPTLIAYLAFKAAKEMHVSTRKLLESMADAVDLRDPYTGGHSRRVAELCGRILEALRIYGVEAELTVTAARLHDIGKIAIPDDLLKKPGKLSPDEWELMTTHVNHAADLLARYPDFSRGVEIILHHHEHYDGRGYPQGLRGKDIPFGSRVIAVADAYDAMMTDRPYRKAIEPEMVRQILREGRGVQWDPDVVDALFKALEEPEPEEDHAGSTALAFKSV